MDIGTLRGLGTLLIMVAFIGLVIWAYSGKRKKSFDEATMLPFADDPEAKKHVATCFLASGSSAKGSIVASSKLFLRLPL